MSSTGTTAPATASSIITPRCTGRRPPWTAGRRSSASSAGTSPRARTSATSPAPPGQVALVRQPRRAVQVLESAQPLAEAEPGTTAWFAIKISESTFGIVDFFPDAAARQADLDSPIAAALMERAGELLASPPD